MYEPHGVCSVDVLRKVRVKQREIFSSSYDEQNILQQFPGFYELSSQLGGIVLQVWANVNVNVQLP